MRVVLPIDLVGLNESGKSTILEGIEHIGKYILNIFNNKDHPLLTNGDLQKIEPKGLPGDLFNDSIIFSCTIEIEKKEIDFSSQFFYYTHNYLLLET